MRLVERWHPTGVTVFLYDIALKFDNTSSGETKGKALF